MASNLVVARGGVEFVPPISLAFWRWTLVFLLLLPFTYVSLKKNFKIIKKEYKKVQCTYQNLSIRISAKKRDELQEIIQFLKNSNLDIPINFGNFRD